MATNTTATSTQHNGNGSLANFAISFSFLENTEVDVTVGGVLKTLGTHYTISGSTVTFTSGNIPPAGTNNVKFQRDTNISTKKVDFKDGSVLTETDLDNNSDQILFAQQEITDKLNGIEDGATADQTAAEIRTLVESATDSNVFTDADHQKLNDLDLTKLQGIATGAEVNVNADWSSSSGDSEILNKPTIPSSINDLTDVNTAGVANGKILKYDSTTSKFIIADDDNTGGGGGGGSSNFIGLTDTPVAFSGAGGKTVKVNSSANALEFVDLEIATDSSPQLGADLDVQTSEINTSTSNGNIKLNPNGSGAVEVKGDGSSNDGKLQLNCSQNSHGVKLQSPAHSAGQSYTMILPDNQIAADKFLKVKSITGSGATAVGQLEYADGGGGATGGGGEKIFHESENQMDQDYTITANHNAIVPTPLTINATLTVGATSTVTFV